MNNPFAIFDLPVDFNIDQVLLSARYLDRQKALHPDNFVMGDEREQRLAIQKSTEVNDALKILKDPILRAEAIIALNTGEILDVELKSTQDVSFLMQQLEWREALEKIEEDQDSDALFSFSKKIKQESAALLKTLDYQLHLANWAEATLLCDKLRFIKKLNNEVECVEDRLFDQ